MRVLRPWLFACLTLTAVLAQSCGNNAGTNPFLQTDASDEDSSESDMGPDVCTGCTVSGQCFNGDEQTRCGAGGSECVACSSGEVCDDQGACIDEPACGPSNCDGCCDATGACITESDNTACGASGLLCTNCGAGSSCDNGVCRAPCGPDNCPGCCDATGACITGDADGSCGIAGGACTDCSADGDSCSSGQCVSAACADTCAGCCDGDTCVEPTTQMQCGAAGAACTACPTGSDCDSGVCAIDPASTWTLFIASGEVAATTGDGSSWDGFNGLPDPYVTAVIANQADASTDVVDDNLAPMWNVALITGATAEDLTTSFQLQYRDDDAAFDDEICDIDVVLVANDAAFAGGLTQSTCPDAALGSVIWRLEPAP